MKLNFFKTCLVLLVTTAMKKKKKNNNRRKENKVVHHHPEHVNIVGPDCIQVLQGKLFQKEVALVLCGESHFDAIDVTRQGGYFHAKEGWVEIMISTTAGVTEQVGPGPDATITTACCRIVTQTKRHLPLEKAKEWAKAYVQDQELWGHLVLLWKQHTLGETRKQKGKAFLIELESIDEIDTDDDDDDDDDEWVCLGDSQAKQERLPLQVQEWIESISSSSSSSTNKSNATTPQPQRVFEWGDLDPDARILNKRRLTDEEIPETELDAIVEKRKEDRRHENIWTWDDWFAYIQRNINESSCSNNKQARIALHLILEATVPPFELDLYHPHIQDLDQLQLPPAAECVRCRSKDEEGSSEYDHNDPSSDGVGSYMDFIYRRFMGEMISSSSNDGLTTTTTTTTRTWLHCVDPRDLGCQAACHADCIKEKWHDLLLPEERQRLLHNPNVAKDDGGTKFQQLSPDAANEKIQFVPACQMNPEERELQMLQARGLLKQNDDDDDADDDAKDGDDDDNKDFTFPSFEGFFGQNSDFLYYDNNVKLSYSAFLANCVGSLSNWEKFFTHLFLGGTIPDALAVLNLGDAEKRASVHVRSPILKAWNAEESCFDYQRRDDKEHYISYPFFPYIFHLVAKDSSPPRTWSSQLFVTLQEQEEQAVAAAAASASRSTSGVAAEAKNWFLETVRRHSDDPKGSDDIHGGGEWFEAFLRAAHRDIYDDIDLSDPTVLLRKNYMPSEENSRLKHNIGKIKIPSCSSGFDEITERFRTAAASDNAGKVITDRVEVMASILIDIYMSSLIDFLTVLKVAKIVNDEESSRVIVVCYMGSVHTRAVGDFYCKRIGFKKKAFVGKLDWDENEPQLLNLPPTLWNVSDLFGS
jgi:hypothetical protein